MGNASRISSVARKIRRSKSNEGMHYAHVKYGRKFGADN